MEIQHTEVERTKTLILVLEEQFKKNIYDEKNINKFFTLFDDNKIMCSIWENIKDWIDTQENNSWCNLYKGLIYTRLSCHYCDESFEKSAKLGNMFGEYYWGVGSLMYDRDTYRYEEDKSIVTKIEFDSTNFIKLSAEKGLLQAQIELVNRCISGLGVEKNLLNAIKWIKIVMNNKNIYNIMNITNDYHICDILDISQILLKENEELKQIILELELRPPELGGPSYQDAKHNFEQNIKK